MDNNNLELEEKEPPIQIFSKIDGKIGVNVVKSPVKLTILSMLKNNEMEFDEIVKNTGKSKSTISVHLKSLREDGIVSYKFDPNDHRKKIFYIKSRCLGEIEAAEPVELEERKIDFLIDNILNETNFQFSFLLFHTLRSTLIQEGINIDPILLDTGRHIGETIYEELKDDDVNVFTENIINFWKDNGLGELSIKLGDTIEITSVDCFECGLLPKTGKPACFLDAGIIESLLASYLKQVVEVTEIKCYTMGDNCCTFLVELTDEEFIPLVESE